jgi:aspartyl-tRNA(Asn)/glutamyl-tRNA(Gln) amidotransferase subunit A
MAERALHGLTIHEARDLLAARRISSRELLESVESRIAAVEPAVHAYVSLTRDPAREQANAADRRLRAGEPVTPLTGIPIALKDNLCVNGVKTTCASKILEGFVAPYDATVIARLRSAGAVFTGKTNMDEFAMGSSTENSAFGNTKNPWGRDRIPGGSSGGSAAAVVADECLGALGSDTGGSIRQPAACCGVVGFKPTYGRVSRYGLVAFASSLDQIGPLAKDVEDCALLLNAIAGHDANDSTSADVPRPDYTTEIKTGVRGLRVGVPKEYFIPGMDRDVEDAVKAAIRALEREGARVEDVSLPNTEYAVAVYYLLATAEASSNLARYDGVRYGYRAKAPANLMDLYFRSRAEGFGPEVKRRIMLGTYALSSGYYDAYYVKAQRVRTLITRDFDRAFERVDVIATPTAPTPAFRIGEKTQDPLQMYLSDIFTISANLAGVPALSMPCGFSGEGLPIGLQLIGKPFAESTILRAAAAYERVTDWTTKKPTIG